MDIFASKLFKSSSRQDKIRAAVNDPMNIELVKQISKYVDPEYREYTKKKDTPDNKSENDEDKNEFGSDSDFESESTFSESPASSDFTGPSLSEKFDKLKNSDIPDESQGPDIYESGTPVDNTNEEVSEAEDIDTEISISDKITNDLDTIKDKLESNEDTSGVARIQFKKSTSELWVYYTDKVNLNTIMESVISVVSDLGYEGLEFNRLARTENAVVFSVDEVKK